MIKDNLTPLATFSIQEQVIIFFLIQPLELPDRHSQY